MKILIEEDDIEIFKRLNKDDSLFKNCYKVVRKKDELCLTIKVRIDTIAEDAVNVTVDL